MKTHVPIWSIVLSSVLICTLALPGCEPQSDHTPSHQEDAHTATPTNRVDIPSAVRSNLGITFVTVERRHVERTLRVPGRFELLPTARREYRTMLPGRVELSVEQYQKVETGQLLYEIQSPAWRELQRQLSEVEATVDRLQVKLTTFGALMVAHEVHEESLQKSVAIWKQRVEQLDAVRDAGGGRASQLVEAQAALATSQAELSEVLEKDARLEAQQAEAKADLIAARSRKHFLLESAGLLLNRTRDQLLEPMETADGPRPYWHAVSSIDVRADEAGVVESLGLTNGAWADQKTTVLTVIQPHKLRFHASGLQSDLGALRDGLAARIVPPTPTRSGRAVDLQDTMSGIVMLGLAGDPNDRTIDLYVVPDQLSEWARDGITAQLEIATDTTAHPELAIPLAAVQHDGIVPVIFKRDAKDPNTAIRLDADLGLDDGRWVAVLSGVRDGDQVILDGAFQLMLATSGTMQKGGHFHADGTFHAEDH